MMILFFCFIVLLCCFIFICLYYLYNNMKRSFNPDSSHSSSAAAAIADESQLEPVVSVQWLNPHIESIMSPCISIYKPEKPLIIFDWDDTLFFSSALGFMPQVKELVDSKMEELKSDGKRSPKKIKLDTVNEQVLDIYDERLFQYLTELMKYFNICIVTNAGDKDWVEASSSTLPRSHSIIMSLIIIYSQVEFRKYFPGPPPDDNEKNYSVWKKIAFKSVLNKIKHNGTIICIGDSDQEMEAIWSIRNDYESLNIKTIKMYSYPNIDGIILQFRKIFDIIMSLIEDNEVDDYIIDLVSDGNKYTLTDNNKEAELMIESITNISREADRAINKIKEKQEKLFSKFEYLEISLDSNKKKIEKILKSIQPQPQPQPRPGGNPYKEILWINHCF